jgi:CHAT domain-containing protein
LIDHLSVRYVPSLTSLLVPWDGNREGDVLAVGVAKFDDRALPELPGADIEATAIAAAHGAKGHALLSATRAQFMSEPLSEYRCVHLATHGSSVLAGDAPDDPMESCVYLRDGALSGFDIAALTLRAELVVLGACHSGQRAIAGRGLARLPGDDLFGLQGVLFEAGVGAVLGALWVVHDEVAREILTEFHRAYAAGAAPEEALRSAVMAYRRERRGARGVFYWPPFFLSSLGRASAPPPPRCRRTP